LNADGSDIDVSLFADMRSDSGTNEFKVIYQDRQSVIGTYPLKLRAHFSDSTKNFVDSPTFIVEIVDPCSAAVEVYPPSSLINQVYTITDNAHPGYTIPSFTPNPSWCTVTYTYSVSDISGSPAVAFDPEKRNFRFLYY